MSTQRACFFSSCLILPSSCYVFPPAPYDRFTLTPSTASMSMPGGHPRARGKGRPSVGMRVGRRRTSNASSANTGARESSGAVLAFGYLFIYLFYVVCSSRSPDRSPAHSRRSRVRSASLSRLIKKQTDESPCVARIMCRCRAPDPQICVLRARGLDISCDGVISHAVPGVFSRFCAQWLPSLVGGWANRLRNCLLPGARHEQPRSQTSAVACV